MKFHHCLRACGLIVMVACPVAASDVPNMADAVEMMRQRKWAEAATAFEEITKAEPNNATALFNLGYALKSGGKQDRAKEVFRRVVSAYEEIVKANPNSGTAWYNLAYALRAIGETDRALDTYEKATIFRDVRARAYVDTARLHALGGRKDQAFAALEEAQTAGLPSLSAVANDPEFKNLRNDERFSRLLGHDYHKLKTKDGTVLEYALVKPDNFDKSKTYPALLAITGGSQDREAVDWGLQHFWGSRAGHRGWIVVSPIAPDGVLFFKGSQRYIPELLDEIQKEFKIEGGKFHLVGRSAGGISAFPIALDSPERFQSITTLPGHPIAKEDFDRLERLKDVRVTILLAEDENRHWGDGAKFTVEKLKDLGVDARYGISMGEGHAMPSLRGDGLMKFLDEQRAEMSNETTSTSE